MTNSALKLQGYIEVDSTWTTKNCSCFQSSPVAGLVEDTCRSSLYTEHHSGSRQHGYRHIVLLVSSVDDEPSFFGKMGWY